MEVLSSMLDRVKALQVELHGGGLLLHISQESKEEEGKVQETYFLRAEGL